MKSKRNYMSTFSEYESIYQPKEIWEFLVHPKYTVEFTEKPCYYNEIPDDFKLEKSNEWKEIHTGEDCKGDIVICTIKEIKEYEIFTEVRHQTGIKNTIITSLKLVENGTLIKQYYKYALSLKNFKPINVLNWFFLVSSILTRFAFDPEGDKFWFKNVEVITRKNVGREPVTYVANINRYFVVYKQLAALKQTRAAQNAQLLPTPLLPIGVNPQ